MKKKIWQRAVKDRKKTNKHTNRHRHTWEKMTNLIFPYLQCKTCGKISIPGKAKNKKDKTKGCFSRR